MNLPLKVERLAVNSSGESGPPVSRLRSLGIAGLTGQHASSWAIQVHQCLALRLEKARLEVVSKADS